MSAAEDMTHFDCRSESEQSDLGAAEPYIKRDVDSHGPPDKSDEEAATDTERRESSRAATSSG